MTRARNEAFARRLNRTLDEAGFAVGHRRTSALAEEHEVSRETARKWLAGLSLPELPRLIQIAMHHEVNLDWLATGRGEPQLTSAVADVKAGYGDPEEARLLGLMRRLPRKKRRALLTLLSEDG
jgi:hypothetical protein